MKNRFTSIFISITLIGSLSLVSCKEKSKSSVSEERQKEVVVYAYDSFAGEWGAAPAIIEKFEKATGYKLTVMDMGDAVQAYTKAVLEKDNVQADVILGIDNTLVSKARSEGILESYKPVDADKIIAEEKVAELGGDWLLTPFDYSFFAMIYNSQSSVPAPKSLADLTDPMYEKKIILMDPRTSTPGLGFLAWTVSVYGDGQELLDYWTALKPNILAMTSGWSEGWGMFSNGEAPLCVSYTTSPAYNAEYDQNYRDVALIFEQGHVEQVEGLGLLKNAPNAEGGKAFIDFMITAEAQSELLFTQWMYPINTEIGLPKSYTDAAPVAGKILETYSEKTESVVDSVMKVLGK